MKAGDLPDRVTIQTRAETTDGHDGYTESWSAVRSRIAAQVIALAGHDLDRARQIDPRAGYEVRVRWWSAYGTDLDGGRARLIWHDGAVGNRTLEIVEPPREVDRRVMLAMRCRELA